MQDKLRTLELVAGRPKRKSGPKKGEPKKKPYPGGRKAKRRADYDLARLAQAQYEQMMKHWEQSNPEKRSYQKTA